MSTTGTAPAQAQSTKPYMNRTFNFFGQLLINYSDLGVPRVIGNRLLWDEIIKSHAGYDFAPDSIVSLEVNNHLGFGDPIYEKLGTWSHHKNAVNIQLSDDLLKSLDNLALHLVVTDVTKGEKSKQPICHIKGVAWNIRVALPEIEGRLNLLPICSAELGELPYAIEFPPKDAGVPVLQINRTFGDPSLFVMSQMFITLVLPNVVEKLFNRIDPAADYDENAWQGKFIKWATGLFEAPPEMDEDEEEENESAYAVWLENVVGAFCNHFAMATRLAETLEEERNA